MVPGIHPPPIYEILSTMPSNSYECHAGTSMATPFVAGLAALIRAKYPALTASQTTQKILDTADNIEPFNLPKYKGLLGTGRINALRALTSLYPVITSPANGSTVDAAPVEIIGSATGRVSAATRSNGARANPRQFLMRLRLPRPLPLTLFWRLSTRPGWTIPT